MRALIVALLLALQGVALQSAPLDLQVVYKKYLVKNAKIASLQAQIDSLQAQAQAVSRWDNPILYVGYNNADVNNFFILDSSFMQSISVGLSQKFDVTGKRHTQKQVVQLERQKKILELEQLKQQIAINILTNAVNVYKNTQKLALLKDALGNLDSLLYRAEHSSSPDQIAIAKLEVIKAQWEIKQNDLQDSLADNKINISEFTFNQVDLLSLAPSPIAFKPDNEIKEIMDTNRTIKIASLQDGQALKNITLAKKSFLEDINVTANYLFRSKIFDMFTIGVAIPLPIYGKQSNTLQQRKQEHLVALNALENTKNSVQHNARKLIKKLTQLQKNLANIEQILQASEHIVQIYKDNLPSSQGDYNSYYNAFNDTINTKLLQLETQSTLATTYLALENLKGLK
ncbi:copper resistance outer membrane protein CrdB [Helicobacter ailurogastricus]|uniref:Heavy metal RND efflux outer membrane protein, CzcC family n=1 Tax=Helicobacter ailurogastricus TaxID=1578720 RepID=A0A0K2X544_9HELI|nr:copper resistance outer membrane protein CrdB [Helicobacter ailurogastricus]CRF41547.1 Heavy metal RND efflux outer membrane protein, CzcC family [Helicobacter ailurogastricus]CRF43266.1 Heavy metal RND efflux outer membrane protein, CzcC family [Helicobacter ailurogastricus]CRF44932.1 Heavy metal RND efflux outer membrane protein, CzcC family [Helicobacter ailurogastricus]